MEDQTFCRMGRSVSLRVYATVGEDHPRSVHIRVGRLQKVYSKRWTIGHRMQRVGRICGTEFKGLKRGIEVNVIMRYNPYIEENSEVTNRGIPSLVRATDQV